MESGHGGTHENAMGNPRAVDSPHPFLTTKVPCLRALRKYEHTDHPYLLIGFLTLVWIEWPSATSSKGRNLGPAIHVLDGQSLQGSFILETPRKPV